MVRSFKFLLLLAVLGTLHGCISSVHKNEMTAMSNDLDKGPAIAYGLQQIDQKGQTAQAIPFYVRTARLYLATGDLSKAEKLMEQLEVFCLDKASRGYASNDFFNGIDEAALLRMETGNFYKAEDLLEKSRVYRNLRYGFNSPFSKGAHLGLGILAYRNGEFEEATEYFHEYIKAVNRNTKNQSKRDMYSYADAHYYFALTLMELGETDLALDYARKNKFLQQHRWTQGEVGANLQKIVQGQCLAAEILLKKGNLTEAKDLIDKAFLRYKYTIGLKSHQVTPVLVLRARIAHAMKQDELAQANFEKGIGYQLEFLRTNFNALTEYEKGNFYQTIRTNLHYYQSFCIDLIEKDGQASHRSLVENMLNWNLTTKAIILNESKRIISNIYQSEQPKLIATYEEWKKLKNEYSRLSDGSNTLEDSRAQLFSRIGTLEKELLRNLPQLEVQFTDWQDIKQNLRPEEVAIEVIRVPRGDETAYLYYGITANGKPQFEVITTGNRLEKQYIFYKNSIQSKSEDQLSSGFFWEPIRRVAGEKKVVLVSPDGIYNLINLDILVQSDGSYLGESIQIYNLTSLKDLRQRSGKIQSLDGLLVGRPTYYTDGTLNDSDGEQLRSVIRGSIADLPGTEKEVTTISSLLSAHDFETKVLLGDDAEEAELKKAPLPPVIHFATHGFFEPTTETETDAMLQTGLLLCGAGDTLLVHGEDGILTAYEATTLDLQKTDLVVMSACETGLGAIADGEGVYGLQRAFRVSNVDYIIMAMWKVDDAATEILFSSFYESLVATKDVHSSLASAQKAVRKKYPDVKYWGAFKVIGG